MNKYVVTATATPTNYNRPESYIVEAGSEDDARVIVKHQLRDLGEWSKYVYVTKPYVAPPPGRILGSIGGASE